MISRMAVLLYRDLGRTLHQDNSKKRKAPP